MAAARRFPRRLVEALDKARIVGIRAGTRPHRLIGVWVVVVEGRAFVRSWGRQPGGWYHTFLGDPRGVLEVDGRRIAIRAVPAKSVRLEGAVTRAYREKYPTPGSAVYVRGFARPPRRHTTTELVPRRATS